MPCDSSHMEAQGFEVEMSKVACLLDELDGKAFTMESWRGYHPRVYCKPQDRRVADEMTADLCRKLQGIDVTKQSLEMQIWWRDHQAADEARVKREVAAAEAKDAKATALAKLTPYERKLLGVD